MSPSSSITRTRRVAQPCRQDAMSHCTARGGPWEAPTGNRGSQGRSPPRPRRPFSGGGAVGDTLSMAQPAPTQERPLRELRGVVERITYQNPENGFTVARLAPERPEAEAEAARGEDRLV